MPRLADMLQSQRERTFQTETPEAATHRAKRWITRNEQARFYRYRYRKRKLLPPLKKQLNL